MSAQSPRPTDSDGMTRRGLMRRTAATGTALGGMMLVGDRVVPQFSPIGRAQAIAPAAVVAYVGVGAVMGWAVRETEIIGADDPPEGTTPETLKNNLYQTARTRQSTNASTFIDNQNILDGLQHAIYGDGKVAAIEALNEQKTKEEVTAAATDAADDYEATIKSNLLKSWNESVREFGNLWNSAYNHSDVDHFGLVNWSRTLVEEYFSSTLLAGESVTDTREITLPDGSTFNLELVSLAEDHTGDNYNGNYGANGSDAVHWDPLAHHIGGNLPDSGHSSSNYPSPQVTWSAGSGVSYLSHSEWNEVWSKIETAFTEARDGLIMWVDNIYGQIQSGELNTEDLLTPRELAEMTASEEGVNQAIADLMALNIPVDLEREATISIEQDSATISLKGALAPTSEPEGGMPAGETYDPETLDYDVYFNYDVTQGTGQWLAYEEGVDGGVVTFTAEPAETEYGITTAAGEEVAVNGADFEPDSESNPTAWTVDLSGDLENAITSIESVEMLAESGDTRYELIQLQEPFTIETYEDSEGNEHDNANFEQSEPQDDTNYITKEEWEEMRKRNEELIEKYENAKEDETGVDIPGPEDLFGGGGSMLGLGLIGVVLLAVAGFVMDLIPGLGN